MQFTTLRTFDNPIKAHLLKSRLENEEIPCYLFDEHMVSINPLYNQTLQGIKLKVNSFDYERANLIASEFEEAPHIDRDQQQINCPKCESSNLIADFKTFRGIKGVFSAIVTALLGVWPIYRLYILL